MAAPRLRAAHEPQDDGDGQHGEHPKRRRDPVQLPVRVVDLQRRREPVRSGLHGYLRLSYATMFSHSKASDRATTATTGSVSLKLRTSCGIPGSMKMKS